MSQQDPDVTQGRRGSNDLVRVGRGPGVPAPPGSRSPLLWAAGAGTKTHSWAQQLLGAAGGHAPCLAQRPSAPSLCRETKSRRREGSDFSGSDCGGGMSTHLFPNRRSSDAPALLPSPTASHSLLASPLSVPSASPYATG